MRGILLILSLIPLLAGCGPQNTPLFDSFKSDGFGFEVTVPDDLGRAGWAIIHARDATVVHAFSPPDSSTWKPVAVVVPPGALFPLLSPIFIDVFNIKDPTLSPGALAVMRAVRVADRVLKRTTFVEGGVTLAQIVHGTGDNLNYETYAVGNGLGYAFLAQGAPDTSLTASSFRVDSGAYERITRSLRLFSPR